MGEMDGAVLVVALVIERPSTDAVLVEVVEYLAADEGRSEPSLIVTGGDGQLIQPVPRMAEGIV